MLFPLSKKYKSTTNKTEINNVTQITTGRPADAPKAFCEISSVCDRSKYRQQNHDPWNDRLPRFDMKGLLGSIELLPTRAVSNKNLFQDIWLIIEKYMWPPTSLALLLYDENNKPILYCDDDNILPYKVSISDFGLDKTNSLSSYSLEYDIPLFIYNAKSTKNTVQAIFKMEGTPVLQEGKFQEYGCFSREEANQFDSSLVLKDKTLLRDAVIIPLVKEFKKLGLLFVGEEFPIFDNACGPSTRFDMPWFLKTLGTKIILSYSIIENHNMRNI